MIREANLPSVSTHDGWASALLLKAVLRVLDDHGGGRECYLKHVTIAREAQCSLRQAKRASQGLRELSLITVERRRTPAGPVCNHYRIVWTELALLRSPRAGSAAIKVPAVAHDQSATPREQSATRVDQSASPGTFKEAPIRSAQRKRPPPQSSSVVIATEQAGVIAPGWKEAEEELLRLGVRLAAIAVSRARKRGLTSQNVLDLAEYYRAHQGQWKPDEDGTTAGVLYFRVSCGSPLHGTAEGWLQFDDGYRRRKTDAARLEQAAREKAAQSAQQMREKHAAEQRELQFGRQLDAMSDEEYSALVEVTFSAEAQAFYGSQLRRPPADLLRPILLEQLALQETRG